VLFNVGYALFMMQIKQDKQVQTTPAGRIILCCSGIRILMLIHLFKHGIYIYILSEYVIDGNISGVNQPFHTNYENFNVGHQITSKGRAQKGGSGDL